MLHPGFSPVVGVAAGLQQIEEAHQVGFDVHVRVIDGIAHARLGRQIHHHRRLIFRKGLAHCRLVRDVDLQEDEVGVLQKLIQPVLLQRDLVIIVHIVDADHGDAFHLVQQTPGQEEADEAGRAGDKDRFALQLYIGFQHMPRYSFFTCS